MKCYIAICATLELKAARKLVETIRVLANRLLHKEFVKCSLLSIGEKTELLCRFYEELDDTKVKEQIDKITFTGLSDLESLKLYFNPINNGIEDGICFIICDRFQYIPENLKIPIDYAFGVFYNLSEYPVFQQYSNWNPYDIPKHPNTADEFAENICSVIKSVHALVIELTFDNYFGVSLSPRLPQKVIFEDPDEIYPENYQPSGVNLGVTGLMKLIGFIPLTAINALPGKGCTYFLKPAASINDKQSYFNISKYLYEKQKSILLLRNSGDYFLLKSYRPLDTTINDKLYLLIEYITTSNLQFINKSNIKNDINLTTKKYIFSYDSHTSFATKESMELALNRINRMIKRETDITIIQKELLLAMRHMAVSCHNILAIGVINIIRFHINTVPRELISFYRQIEKHLTSRDGCTGVVRYLEQLQSNSRK